MEELKKRIRVLICASVLSGMALMISILCFIGGVTYMGVIGCFTGIFILVLIEYNIEFNLEG